MKEFFASIDRTKFRVLVWCVVLTIMVSIGTAGIVALWVLGSPPSSYLISMMVLAWVWVAVFFFFTVSTCCVRMEKEVEYAARDQRMIRNLRDRYGLAEDKRSRPVRE
jgi:hypothetical protein